MNESTQSLFYSVEQVVDKIIVPQFHKKAYDRYVEILRRDLDVYQQGVQILVEREAARATAEKDQDWKFARECASDGHPAERAYENRMKWLHNECTSVSRAVDTKLAVKSCYSSDYSYARGVIGRVGWLVVHTNGLAGTSLTSIAPDVEARIDRKANDYAAFTVAEFAVKMIKKLESIVESKGNLTAIEVHGSGVLTNVLKFVFADGSSFQVFNDIVVACSNRGVVFNRFPTTFRDVVLPDGSRMKSPSEAKVKKTFVK